MICWDWRRKSANVTERKTNKSLVHYLPPWIWSLLESHQIHFHQQWRLFNKEGNNSHDPTWLHSLIEPRFVEMMSRAFKDVRAQSITHHRPLRCFSAVSWIWQKEISPNSWRSAAGSCLHRRSNKWAGSGKLASLMWLNDDANSRPSDAKVQMEILRNAVWLYFLYDSIFIKQWNSLLMWFSESARDREIVLSVVGTLKKKQAFCHK